MIIASTLENKEIEKRIAITPEITKKYINLGFQIQLIENYGTHIGFDDSQFKNAGAKAKSANSQRCTCSRYFPRCCFMKKI